MAVASTRVVMQAGALVADRFELRRQLGNDASTIVWEAFDAALDRRVLIKLLRPELVHDPHAVERFRQESRRAAQAASTEGRRLLDAGFDKQSSLPFAVFELQEDWAGDDLSQADRPAETQRIPVQVDRAIGRPSGTHRVVQSVVVLLLVVPVLAGVLFVRQVLDDSTSAASKFVTPPRVTLVTSVSPVSRETPITASAAERNTPASASPSPTATRVAEVRRRIVNTDGIGVALRASPGGDRLPGKGYDEGVTVTLLEQSGEWAHIRGDDGREGWVLAVTLG